MEPEAGGRLPLSGVRVIELSVAIAGPTAGRYLAHFGAEVIRVESRKRPDNNRQFYPAGSTVIDPDLAPSFGEFNANKLSLGLNLEDPRGIEIVRRLARISDVVLDNFAARVLENFGLDYERLHRLNPRIILARMQGQGSTGPRRDFISYGEQIQCLTAIKYLTAYEGGQPNGPGSSYPDHVSGVMAAFAVVAALLRRQKSGAGQQIDLSQAQATTAMLGPILMDALANGRSQTPLGNRDPAAAPHGVYRSAGDDRWIAIAVHTEQQWQALCRVMGAPALAADPRFAALPGRLANQDALDLLVETWTAGRDPGEAMAALTAAGVPAGAVQDTPDLIYRDPHLAARRFILAGPHKRRGTITFGGVGTRLAGVEPPIRWASALLGEHTEYVLGDLLHMDPTAIADLAAAGVLDLPEWPEGGPDPALAIVP